MCLVNGAKESHGIQTSGTGAADYIPACHRTSLTTETEGGERVSQLCPVTESRDPPASSPGSRATDVFTVSDNLSPTYCPNVWRKTIGGWSEGRTGQHIRPMEFRERTVCLPALILRKEDRCRLDCGIPFSRDTTTIESSQLSPTHSTFKNCVLHATDGAIRWHSILQGCRKSEHRRFSHSYMLQRGRQQHFNRIAADEWCRATPLRRHYFNDIGNFIHDDTQK